jgi:hypothetical protein
MSSRLSKIAKPNRRRKGLNTRGDVPGFAQMPTMVQKAHMDRHGQGGFRTKTDDHDMERADKGCRICHGTGAIKTAYVDTKSNRAACLVCSCVPMKEAANA